MLLFIYFAYSYLICVCSISLLNFLFTKRFFSSAELTKWNLIFYGTETPAQPDSDFVPGAKIDPLNSGGHLGIGEGEAGQHNFVQDEYVGSKWRDEQKVRLKSLLAGHRVISYDAF